MTPRYSIAHLRTVARLSSGAPTDADALSRSDSLTLTDCAVAHGLGAAVFLALERAQLLDTWDVSSLDAFRDDLITTTGANLRRATQLSAILTTLEAAAITALAYKGPSLAWQAYGHIGARLFDDLDLLVAPADRAAASRALEAVGYTRDLHESRLGAVLPAVAHVDRLLPSTADGVPVEIHSSVAPWRLAARLPAADALSRRVPCPLPTGADPTLSTEDTLIALSVHASTHTWSHVRFACEIAGVTRRAPVDWDLLRDRASGARVAREVRVGVLMANDLCAAPLPSDVFAWADRDRVARIICADRIAALCDRRPPPERWQGIRAHLRYREHLLDKARYFARNEIIGWAQKLPWERWRGR